MDNYLVRQERIPKRARYPAIDFHNHLWGDWSGLGEIHEVMVDCGVEGYCDLTADIHVEWQETSYRLREGSFDDYLQAVEKQFPGKFYAFTTAGLVRTPDAPLFSDAAQFVEKTLQRLEHDVRLGALGLKATKELGLMLRDASGARIRICDERLAPVWQRAGELGLPVLIHTADPFGFFQPVTPDNEHYPTLQRFRDWDFSDRKRWPEFGQLQLEYRELLRSHPGVQFVAPHFCNWPENLDYLQGMMEECPNLWLDFSARVDELGRQPYRVREFFLRNADRILFGVDMPVSREVYRFHFRFLETFDEDFDPPFYDGKFSSPRWRVHGIGLPGDVLRKVYFENAIRLIPALKSRLKAFRDMAG